MGFQSQASSEQQLLQVINPTERQFDFLQSIAEYDFVLYGGAAGGGKSYILRWWLVLYLIQLFRFKGLRNVQVAMFCEDYPSLWDRQISKMEFEFPAWLGRVSNNPTNRCFQLHERFGSGCLALRNLDDPSKYQSAEFAAIAVDELTKNSKETFDFLRMRRRWPGVERPKFAAATNPGGKGHAWVKKLWIQRDFPPELETIASHFAFVPAKAADNPHLTDSYYQELKTLPPDMAKKFAEGDWDVYTGQYFPYFDPKIHVIPHKEALERIKPWHTRSLSGDWGYEHPHAFHWHAKDERNVIITFDELWDRHIHETEVGKRITLRESLYHELRPLSSFTFVWDAGKLSPRSIKGQPKSIVQLIQDGLGPSIPLSHPADSSPGVRLLRARLMSQLLGHPGDPALRIPVQKPHWFISDKCTKLIQAIPIMIQDEEKPEEMFKLDWNEAQVGDDPVDSASVGLQWLVGNSVTPVEVVVQEKVAAYVAKVGKEVEDMEINSLAQLTRRATYQEQKKRRHRRGGLGRIWRPQN